MAMERMNPFTDLVSLRDAMDRLFEQSVVRPARTAAQQVTRSMAVNLYEKDDRYFIQAFLPGVKAEDVNISVDQNTVSIKAHIPGELEKEEAKNYNWYIAELGYGDISRSVTLPFPIDAGAIEASQENGVLTVAVPKAEEAKPRQIKVKTGK